MLVVEGLSSLIKHVERQHLIHGVKICRGASTISHLLFADDCMFSVEPVEKSIWH